MNTNEWITDRLPTYRDCVGADRMPDSNQVWVMYEGRVVSCPYEDVVLGCPWQPIIVQKPEPYVKPKRYEVVPYQGDWCVRDSNSIRCFVAFRIGTIKAAERIAAIYEEVTP